MVKPLDKPWPQPQENHVSFVQKLEEIKNELGIPAHDMCGGGFHYDSCRACAIDRALKEMARFCYTSAAGIAEHCTIDEHRDEILRISATLKEMARLV